MRRCSKAPEAGPECVYGKGSFLGTRVLLAQTQKISMGHPVFCKATINYSRDCDCPCEQQMHILSIIHSFIIAQNYRSQGAGVSFSAETVRAKYAMDNRARYTL